MRFECKTRCNVVMFLCLVVCCVFVFPIRGILGNTRANAAGENAKVVSHPVVTTPEKTVEIFLNAFIEKDIKTVMAYVPVPGDDDAKKKREAFKVNALEHMTEKKHVVRIIAIEVEKLEFQKSRKIAHVVAKIEFSPDFIGHGIEVTDAEGKHSSIFRWNFSQENNNDPWMYMEGGF